MRRESGMKIIIIGLKRGRMWDLFTKRRVILMVLISTGGGSVAALH